MQQLLCPSCHHSIDAKNINVAANIAKCTDRNTIFKISELIVDIKFPENPEPPAGSKIMFNKENDNRYSFLLSN